MENVEAAVRGCQKLKTILGGPMKQVAVLGCLWALGCAKPLSKGKPVPDYLTRVGHHIPLRIAWRDQALASNIESSS